MTQHTRQPTIRPLHHSLGVTPRMPYNMQRLDMTADQQERLERIALEIFADCANAGVAFQKALAAIYLSGLNHGYEIMKNAELKDGESDG